MCRSIWRRRVLNARGNLRHLTSRQRGISRCRCEPRPGVAGPQRSICHTPNSTCGFFRWSIPRCLLSRVKEFGLASDRYAFVPLKAPESQVPGFVSIVVLPEPESSHGGESVLLALDVGNSHIVLGTAQEGRFSYHWRMATD